MNDPLRTTAAGAFLSAVSNCIYTTLPLLSGMLADSLHLGFQSIGQVNACYFLGAAVASCSWLWWAPRLTWRSVTNVGVLAMAVALLAGAAVESHFGVFLGTVLAVGLASGALYSLSFAVIASTRQPIRGFGWKLFTEQVLGAAYLYGLPLLITPNYGLTGLLVTLAVGTMLLWPIVAGALPANHRTLRQPSLRGVPVPGWPFWVIIVCSCVFMAGMCAVWMFLERIAVEARAPGSKIGALLAVGILIGCTGALAPTVQAYKWGKSVPLWLSIACLLVMFSLLLKSFNTLSFAVAAVSLPLVLNYVLPYLFDLARERDVSGAYAILPSPALVLGAFAGTLAGGAIAESAGLMAAVLFGAVSTLVALAAVLVVNRTDARRNLSSQHRAVRTS
jgi:predicted MFS family arabinose efflux permease